MSKLPAGWKSARLRDVASIVIGATPSRSNPAYWDPEKRSSNRWVSISDLKGRILFDTAENISDMGAENSSVKPVPAGTTLMSFKLTIGKASITRHPVFTNEAVAALIPNSDTLPEFLYYAAPIAAKSAEADVAIKGKTLNKAKLGELRINLPPLGEQRKISAILVSVDELIEKTDVVIKQSQMVKKSMLQELLTLGLPAVRTARFKRTEVGGTPERWEEVTVGALANFSGGKGFGPADWSASGLPIVRIQNLNGSSSFNFFSGTPEANWIVEPGDLLFAWAGSRGSSFGPCIWPGPRGVLNQHIHKLCPNKKVTKKFLYYLLLLLTERIESRAHGFKQSLVHLRKAELLEQVVALPSLSQQKEIVELLDVVENRLIAEERTLDRLRDAKSALLRALLSGEIRVKPA